MTIPALRERARAKRQFARCCLVLLLYMLIAISYSAIFVGTVQAATTTYYPSPNILTGSHVSGDMTSLVNVDTNYYIVGSAGSATATVPYNPSAYDPLPFTSYISGAVSDLASNDNSLYMTFRSYVSQISTTSPSRASIGYRSNTGTSTLNSPKARSWNGSAWDGTETELSTAGSPVRWVRTAYCPLTARSYEKIVVTLSDDGNLDAYVWTGSSWSVTNNIGSVGTIANAYRPFDIAYEKTSGEAMLVYGVSSTDASQDLAYKTWDGSSWSADPSYINDAGHGTDVQYYWVDLASKPTNGANEISLIALEGTTADGSVRAWIWNGSSWGIGQGLETDTTKDREDIGVTYESVTGYAMFVWGDENVGGYYSRRWLGSSWEGESLVTDWITGSPGWLTLKSDPASNRIMFLSVDSASDLQTVEWDGTTWVWPGGERGVEHDTAVDSTTTRCADFDWEPSGSKGLLIWGTSSNSLSYKTYTASTSTWSGASTITAAGTHRWIQLRRNPRDVTGDVKILGATLNSNNDLGALKWTDTTLTNIGDSVFTDDTNETTYECFDLRFQVLGDPTEFTSEVEFTGSSNTYDWTQLIWTVDSAWTTASVTVTIQLYNYNSGSCPSSGDGYDSYTSGAADTDQTKTQTITTSPQYFRDGSGNWKIKIKGVKATSTQFDFKVDWVEYKTTYPNEYTASTEFNLSGMTGYTPTQLVFTVVSQYDVASVNTTIQVWDYSSGQYATSGEGYLAYTSSGGGNETKNLTITTNPSHYVSSGNATIKITSVKTTTTQFQQKTNQIKLEYTYSPITKIVFTTTAPPITAGAASAIMTIQTQDASSNPVNVITDTTITLSSTSGNGKFSLLTSPWVDVTTVTITAGSNSVSFYYKDTTVGTPTITAAESPSQDWTDATQLETVNPASLDHFTFATISTPQTAGTSFSITITAKDQYENTVTSYAGTNTLSDSTVTISPTSTGAFSSGAWTGSVTITKAQSGVTIMTSGDSKSGTSNSFDVNPSSANKLIITVYPPSVTAGSWTTTYTVQRQDSYANPVTSGSTTVNLTSTSDGANKKFAETAGGSEVTSIIIADGSSTKDFYYYDEKAGTWTISVSATGLTGDSKSLKVNPTSVSFETGTETGLVTLSTDAGGIEYPTTVNESTLPTAGKPSTITYPHGLFSFRVTGLTPGSSITMTITLPSAISPNAQYWKYHTPEGWINVTSLLGSDDGDNILTLTLTDGGLGDDDGDANGIIEDIGGPGIPRFASFTMSGYPSSITAGQNFGSNDITVTAKDAFGNVKTDYTGQVYFTSTDSKAVLPYTSGSKYTFTTGAGGDNGVHTFAGTGFTLKTSGSQTITVTDGTVSATSSSITVNPASLDHFTFATISSPQIAFVPFNLTITAEDAYNNTVTGYTGINQLSDSTGKMSPTSTGAFSSGKWTGSVTFFKVQSAVIIVATGSKSGSSNSFDIIGMQVALDVSQSTIDLKRDEVFNLTAAIGPPTPNVAVMIESSKDGEDWYPIFSGLTNQDGRVICEYRADEEGNYYFRAKIGDSVSNTISAMVVPEFASASLVLWVVLIFGLLYLRFRKAMGRYS